MTEAATLAQHRRRIFIGSSSSKGLSYAGQVKQTLSKDFDVVLWTDAFEQNQSTLADLLKNSLLFDFGIFIGTPDDKVETSSGEQFQARDNVIFELGLYYGRLGSAKCAFILDKEIKLPSDLKGITLAYFERE